MIGYLEGAIIASDDKSVIVHAGGVGWRVFCGPLTLQEWQENGGAVKTFTYLYVREGVQDLFGFRSHEELRFFELLIGVSGVGPRSAQHIIDTLSLNVVVGAVQSKKPDVFTRVSGVGSKIAQRIVIDLEPKLKSHGFASDADLVTLAEEDEAVSALVSLGYKRREAREALEHVEPDVQGPEERVRAALKHLGRA